MDPFGFPYFRTGGDQGSCSGIYRRKGAVPVSVLLYFSACGSLKIHVGHAKHDRHEKYGQKDTDPGHPALPAVESGG